MQRAIFEEHELAIRQEEALEDFCQGFECMNYDISTAFLLLSYTQEIIQFMYIGYNSVSYQQ